MERASKTHCSSLPVPLRGAYVWRSSLTCTGVPGLQGPASTPSCLLGPHSAPSRLSLLVPARQAGPGYPGRVNHAGPLGLREVTGSTALVTPSLLPKTPAARVASSSPPPVGQVQRELGCLPAALRPPVRPPFPASVASSALPPTANQLSPPRPGFVLGTAQRPPVPALEPRVVAPEFADARGRRSTET